MGEAQPSKQLESWKEIAAYFGKDERTVQRWERDRGLPVHRLPGNRSNVFAFTDELDAWQNGQPPSGVENGRPNPPTGTDTSSVPREQIHEPLRNSLVLILMGVMAMASFGALAFMTAMKDDEPEQATYEGTDLVMRNKAGDELWRYRFPLSLRIPDEITDPWQRIHYVDLHGDGNTEVLAALGLGETPKTDANTQRGLWCFSRTGELLWKYEPTELLQFGNETFAPPFIVLNLLITDEADSKRIWVSFAHNTWYPSVLVKLDSAGRELGRFVNAGYIYSLTRLQTKEGDFILAGGVNNEYDSGMLAVLRADSFVGRSPQALGGKYECQGCPAGEPHRYFIFPRSELNRATDSSYNKVEQIQILGDRVKVTTREVYTVLSNLTAEAIFEFHPDFRLIRARPGDSYWNVHRVLERDGNLKHSGLDCQDRNPLTVREWRHGSWEQVSLWAGTGRRGNSAKSD